MMYKDSSTYQRRSESRTLIESLKKRWTIVFFTTLLVFFASMCVVLKLHPLYSSQTTLILPFTPVSELTSRSDNVTSPQSDPLIIHSYIQIMKDDGICLQVIHQQRLADKPEFNPQPNTFYAFVKTLETSLLGERTAPEVDPNIARQDRVLQLYKKRLKISNDGRSLAVDLAFQSEDPGLAAVITNAHANAYLAAQVQYRRREAATKTTWMDQQVELSANDLRAAQAALQLRKSTVGTTSAFAAADSAEFKYRQAILTSKQSVYESLLNRQQIMLAEQHYDGADTRILSPARPSVQPSFPNKPLLGAVALMVALMVGAGLAWAVDLVKQRRKNVDDRLRELIVNKLAFIEMPRKWVLPFMRRLQRLRLSLYWEKIREVRSSFGLWQSEGLVLAMTPVGTKGTAPQIAASLARAIAASGERTLLIDLDLRHPSAHTFFGMERAKGSNLAECLDGKTWGGAVRPVPNVSCLFLLGGLALDDNNIDMLAGSCIKATLAELRREYKAIIIDTPPIGVVCDSLVIADLADQTILICDEHAPAIGGLAEAVAALRRRSAEVRGVIITSRRAASAASCRAIEDYAKRDRLSVLLPLPFRKTRTRQKVETQGDGVLQAAE